MNYTILLFSTFSLLSATGMANANGITIDIKDGKGKDVGTVKIKSIAVGVELKLNLRGLLPGEHAIHFHQTAKCEAPDFKSAGPHFNPDGKKHGLDIHHGAGIGLALAGEGIQRVRPRLALAHLQHGVQLGARSLVAVERAAIQRPREAG